MRSPSIMSTEEEEEDDEEAIEERARVEGDIDKVENLSSVDFFYFFPRNIIKIFTNISFDLPLISQWTGAEVGARA